MELNNKNIGFLTALSLIPIEVPFEFINELSIWDKIIKSPYGQSYYNDTVGWNHKEHGSLRLSNHWNFMSWGKMHCETTDPVMNNTHWTLAKYDKTINKYIVIKSLLNDKKSFRDSFEFTLLEIEAKRKLAILKIKESLMGQKTIAKSIASMELRCLNLYFKSLEKYSLK